MYSTPAESGTLAVRRTKSLMPPASAGLEKFTMAVPGVLMFRVTLKAADRVLEKTAGLRLSESTTERTTEGAGVRLGQWLEAGEVFGPKVLWKWHRDAEGKTCAYVGVDATGIMMQGPDGAKADGRMVNVGMIFNPQPRAPEDQEICKPCDGVRYLAGLWTTPPT